MNLTVHLRREKDKGERKAPALNDKVMTTGSFGSEPIYSLVRTTTTTSSEKENRCSPNNGTECPAFTFQDERTFIFLSFTIQLPLQKVIS